MGTLPPTVFAPRDDSSADPSPSGLLFPAARSGDHPGFDLWSGEGPSVLLIEDDPGDALLVEEMVADSGVAIDLSWARTLAEALDRLDDSVPQCVLLDLHLPDSQGLGALKTVLSRAPGAAVVVLTGLAEEESGLAAVAGGAQDYLIKGRLEADLFVRAIRYAIQRKRIERAAADLQESRLRAEENSRVERGLLPTPLLLDDSPQVCSRYRPGRAQTLLGGDFYDVVQTPDGTTHAVVGDVSGHGPDEAALGVCLRVAWRSFILSGARGQRLLDLLEQMLVAERSGPEIFATLTTLSRGPGSARVDVVRAGHPGLLVRPPDGPVRLEEVPGGPVLGLLPGRARWPVTALDAPPGTRLVLFTDGLIEGRTGRGSERVGEEGLVEIAREHAHLGADAFVDSVIQRCEDLAASSGGLADDVAVLHLGWTDAV
ncbi:PP2C family protein-serine/threonine phosphatase [uncultured Streptomyces sp.]|uniref:PP2C family protein-serine/threonine phosphatase n=1 Tax=uncultured Streptomyces sp. TaxID=174707 RepID=UPI0026387905|nr:SpoIIE family protein phosphatase [uncultured Streptomyces sp.]